MEIIRSSPIKIAPLIPLQFRLKFRLTSVFAPARGDLRVVALFSSRVATMPSLEGYVAFQAERASKVEEEGALKRNMFGAPFQCVPFADTITDSITKALSGKVTCPQAANNATEWWVLKVMMSPEQVLTAFQEGLLGKINGDTPGWRYYGDMPLNAFSIEWLRISVGPVGVEKWADTVLSRSYEHRTGLYAVLHACGAANPSN